MIGAGRITSLSDLKGLYRTAARRTHPDRNPSGEGAFILLTAQYEEALAYLEGNNIGDETYLREEPNHRRDFFYYWLEWENLMMPENRTSRNRDRLIRLPALMETSFLSWVSDRGGLFRGALEEYQEILQEKPPNDLAHLRQLLLREQLKPLVYDICRIGLNKGGDNLSHVERTLAKRIAPPPNG